MRKLIPTRRCEQEAKYRAATPAELEQLSDWALKDIGLFRQAPVLDSVKPFWIA